MTTQEMKKKIVGKTIHYVEMHKYISSIHNKMFDIKVSRLEFKTNFVWIWTPIKGCKGADTRFCTLSREVIKNLADRGESIHENEPWKIEIRLMDNTDEQ